MVEDAVRLLDLYKKDEKAGSKKAAVEAAKPGHHDERALRPMAATALFVQVSPSVLSVEANSGGKTMQGSAVVLAGSGVVNSMQTLVTNAHVVAGANKATVRRGPARFEAHVAHVDHETDIALLWAKTGGAWPTARLGTSTKPKVGESVFAVGSPLGMDNTLSTGIVSGLRDRESVELIQTTASISPGSSGGGLFNEYGELIGITTFKLHGGENLNFAVSTDYVRHLHNALLSWVALATLLDGESESDRLERLDAHGDVRKMLWKTPSKRFHGERAYDDVMRIVDLYRRDGYAAALPAITELLDIVEEQIKQFPYVAKVTAAAPVIRCEVLVAGVVENDTYELDESQSVVRDSGRGLSYYASFKINSVEWNEEVGGVPLRSVYERINGTLYTYLLEDFKSLRRGEMFSKGQCK